MSGGIGSETKMTFPEAIPSAETPPDPAGSTSLDRRRMRITGARQTRPAETRGLLENRSRESLFRRALLTADTVAIVGAFVVLATVSGKSLQLTWVSVCGLLTLLLGAKVMGLYDRDDVLLHKTTLDEAPKLFQVATLGALVAWLAGGFVIHGDLLSRREALLLWLVLILLLVFARASARTLALRALPAERCLFIGDQAAARTIRSKLAGHGGVKAELVGYLDLDDVGTWSTNTISGQRVSEIRELARTRNVHRAIVAPTSADGGEMLDLVRTLKAVGVRVSVLPRLLEVVGSSVEFDDLHGVTLMGVRRFEMTRSSAVVKRAFDLAGASLGLLAVAPLFAVVAVAITLEDRGPVFFGQQRVGRHGKHFNLLKFRTMVPDADALKDSLRRPQRGAGRPFQDRRRPPRDARRATAAQERAGRAAAAAERHPRRDEPRGAAAAGDRRGPLRGGVVPPAPGADAGDDRPLADPRSGTRAAQRDGRDGLSVRRQLVAVG